MKTTTGEFKNADENKFFNGEAINEKNLIAMIQKCSDDNWQNCSLYSETEQALELIATKEYAGKQDDIDCIIEKLQAKGRLGYDHKDANLTDVEMIINQDIGSWNFSNILAVAEFTDKSVWQVLNAKGKDYEGQKFIDKFVFYGNKSKDEIINGWIEDGADFSREELEKEFNDKVWKTSYGYIEETP